jgi:hypothetical protein
MQTTIVNDCGYVEERASLPACLVVWGCTFLLWTLAVWLLYGIAWMAFSQ